MNGGGMSDLTIPEEDPPPCICRDDLFAECPRHCLIRWVTEAKVVHHPGAPPSCPDNVPPAA